MVQMLALVVTCLSLSWVSVSARFWIKIFLIGRIRWDDWILLMTVILFSGQCSCVLVMITGASNHSNTAPDVVPYMFIASYNLAIMTSLCVKTSFALSLNRCFAERWQRLLITIVTLAFYIYAVIRIFLDLFFCGLPSEMVHKTSLQQCKHWSNMSMWWLVAGIYNAVTDWIYILFPAAVIWTSRLSLKIKALVSTITAVGILSGLAAIFRVLGTGSFKALKDLNSTNLNVIGCVVLEMTFAIIATSMTNSTPLPSILAQSKIKDARTTKVAGTCPEEGNANFIKLSPIICPQKPAAGDTWGSSQPWKQSAVLERDILAPPTPAPKTDPFPWSGPLGASEASASKPARLTLIIDDISDDEDDCNVGKGSQRVKQAFTNV